MTTMEDIRRWHVEGRGFRDIGYHFVLEREGQIRLGRPVPVSGAHAKGHNADSIGICVVGDNTDPEQQWSESQWAELRYLVEALRLVWPEAEVLAHCEVGSTECPGMSGRELRERLSLGSS